MTTREQIEAALEDMESRCLDDAADRAVVAERLTQLFESMLPCEACGGHGGSCRICRGTGVRGG